MASVSAYDVILLAHVVLFVYWLGADVGVLYGASFAANPKYSVETRSTVAEIMAFVDLFPRMSVPLIGATGIAMAELRGAIAAPISVWPFASIAAGIWALNGLLIYAMRSNPARTAGLRLFDFWFRVVICLLAAGFGGMAIADVGGVTDQSVAVKLIVYSVAIVLSLVLRRLFAPYRPALARIAATGSNPADEAIMTRALALGRPVVFLIWLCTVVAAAIGLWYLS